MTDHASLTERAAEHVESVIYGGTGTAGLVFIGAMAYTTSGVGAAIVTAAIYAAAVSFTQVYRADETAASAVTFGLTLALVMLLVPVGDRSGTTAFIAVLAGAGVLMYASIRLDRRNEDNDDDPLEEPASTEVS